MQILYVDNHLLVVYKPAGLPVQADASGDIDLLTLAKAWIKKEYSKPGEVFVGLVHRLDRPARGVVVLARTSKAAARLSEQFRSRTTHKRYEVVVLGQPEPPAAELHDQLFSDERGTRVVSSGSASSLHYRTLEHRGDRTWLEVDLHSGRKHQIRVQLASRGWPVLGDLSYGAKNPLQDQSIALLARRLDIDHPTRSERLSFVAPDPPGWPWQPNEGRDFLS